MCCELGKQFRTSRYVNPGHGYFNPGHMPISIRDTLQTPLQPYPQTPTQTTLQTPNEAVPANS